jgi:hypothetical protein
MVVDGLSAGRAVGGVVESPGKETEAISEEKGIDRIVASSVPAVEVTTAATKVVAESDVIALVCEKSEAFLVVERLEVCGVDSQADAIGPGGRARRAFDPFEP